LRSRKTDSGRHRFEAGALRERIAQLESTVQKAQVTTEIEVNHSREALHTDWPLSRGNSRGKNRRYSSFRLQSGKLKNKLGTQVQDLHAQLAAKTDLVENRTAELQSAQSEIGALRQHIQQLDLPVPRRRLRRAKRHESETLQAELGSLRMAFEQKHLTLQQNHAATQELEQRLNVQLRDLESRWQRSKDCLKLAAKRWRTQRKDKRSTGANHPSRTGQQTNR